MSTGESDNNGFVTWVLATLLFCAVLLSLSAFVVNKLWLANHWFLLTKREMEQNQTAKLQQVGYEKICNDTVSM